ncbi:MAG: sugar phosphate isomerase/epimerase [bacterium]|nr:sugar phosphate isomerase/epimerase [bacterium]
MKVLFFCPLWGSDRWEFHDFLRKVTQAGYDGVEMGLPLDKGEKQGILDAIRQYDLRYIAQHYETSTPDFAAHKAEYAQRLRHLAEANPLFINSQTGRDYFSFEQNAELITLAGSISQETGVKIIHETHRGKFSFAAHIAKRFLDTFDDLRLSFDVSHWCNVAESLLYDQEEALQLAVSRAEHIHSRVGFEEGPQIPDPRVPEWDEALQRHLGWWDAIIERARQEEREVFTITSEFGPFPYMPRQPFTQMPISNQWEINRYMKEMLKERYH